MFGKAISIDKQDIGIIFLYLLGYSRIMNLVSLILGKPVVRFITFHDILPEEAESFKAKLFFLNRCANVISLEDFMLRKVSLRKINIVITFDDGYKGWLFYAIPVLKELKLPAIFFISSGFVGLSSDEETKFKQTKLFSKQGTRKTTGCLSFDDLRKIAAEGFAIGGHTINHYNLSDLHNIIQLQFEIAEDKNNLEIITGNRLYYFSYPRGDYHNSTIDITQVLKESGYKGAVTIIPGINVLESNPFMLHREIIPSSLSLLAFKAKVYGNHDAIRFIKKCITSFF